MHAIVLVVESQLATHVRSLKPLLITAWLLSAVLLLRFALDFGAEGPMLGVPFWALVLLALAVMGTNILGHPVPRDAQAPKHHRRLRALLLALIPIGFLASSLDCTGLSLSGCSPFCTFIKVIWIPLIAAACMAYYIIKSGRLLAILSVMSFVPLLPHCVCYNVANAWWIDHVGSSPECYVWGFVVSTLALAALHHSRRYHVTVAISAAIVAGSVGFFVGHHYFKFPW